MGGKVAKKLGDGLMALFGYPVARRRTTPSARCAQRQNCSEPGDPTTRTPIVGAFRGCVCALSGRSAFGM